ncbi:hypothetical protein ACO0QE_001252 [Hanseniaspora vineae]
MNGNNDEYEYEAEGFSFNQAEPNNFLAQTISHHSMEHMPEDNNMEIENNESYYANFDNNNGSNNDHNNSNAHNNNNSNNNYQPSDNNNNEYNAAVSVGSTSEEQSLPSLPPGESVSPEQQQQQIYNQQQQAHSASMSKNKRTRATGHALDLLMREFEMNPSPNPELRKSIALKTGLDEKKVRIWFQNRRAKYKKTSSSTNLAYMGNQQPFGTVPNNGYENINNNNSIGHLDIGTSTVPGNDEHYNMEQMQQHGYSDNSNNNNGEENQMYRASATDMQYSDEFEFDGIPWDMNINYHFIDAMSLTVGSWKRIKSGHLDDSSMPDVTRLSNLSPISINDIMADATDLLVLISKKNYEINYFFSAIAENSKILFRVFFPINSVVNCSLSLTKKDGSTTINSSSVSSPNGNKVKIEKKGFSSGPNNNNINQSSGNGRNANNEPQKDNTADNTEENEDEDDYTELRLLLNRAPKFAVYFSDVVDEAASNQWNICDDFSEGKQVSEAYLGSNEIPHVLKGTEESLKLMNSLILEYNNTNIYPSTMAMPPLSQSLHYQHQNPHQQQQQQQQNQYPHQQQPAQHSPYPFHQQPTQPFQPASSQIPPTSFMSPSNFGFHSSDVFMQSGFTPDPTSDLLMDNAGLQSSGPTPGHLGNTNMMGSTSNTIPETPDFNSLLNFQTNDEE